MATVTELVTRIKARLARRSLININAIIVDEMTHVQTEILEQAEWLPAFLKVLVSFSRVGPHSTIVLDGAGATPELARFIRPLSMDDDANCMEYLVDLAQGIFNAVPRFDSRKQLEQLYPGNGDKPIGCYWDGNIRGAFIVQPHPTATVDYRMRFYQADINTATSPDANNSTLWTRFAGDYLMHTTGQEVAIYLRDEVALNYFSGKRQEAFTRLKTQKTSQDMADTNLTMGD